MKTLHNGWVEGSTREFLGLTPADHEYLETKLALGLRLRRLRARLNLSQTALAARLRTSQSRVAKMEAADPSVSVDLLLNALFQLGATAKDVLRSLPRNLD
jgi:DNA-binding transcriptional regulator YiaG